MSYILVNRHQLSGCLRFDRADVLVNERPSHAYMEILEIEILPFQSGQFCAASALLQRFRASLHNRDLR